MSDKSVLEDIRQAVGLSKDSEDFDPDLLMHINSCIGELNQNGVSKTVLVKDVTTVWDDLRIKPKPEEDDSFLMVPLYVALSTKLLFDPPPPSSVQFHKDNADKLLWRLKIAYEEPLTTTTTLPNGDW